jgi:cobalt/nickel transport protein
MRSRIDLRSRACRAALVAAITLGNGAADAHFQELIPSEDNVAAGGGRAVTLDLVFTHPMARGPAMEMAKPARFGVKSGDRVDDLLATLSERKVDGKTAWRASYRFARPGNYVFFVEPRPYWEPAEGKMIVHFTKVIVDAFGAGQGWDVPVGLPVEILPLARPYGLWTGNVFRGQVLKGGRPVPEAEIEVEWINDGSLGIPADAYETQVIKADGSGIFVYGLPRAGWWGFAALVDGDTPMKNPEGQDVPVEHGGLIWVRARDMK